MAKTGYPSQDRNHEDYVGPDIASAPLPEGYTIYDYLYELNEHRLSLPAISYFKNSITYKSFFESSTLVANALDAIGVKKGDFITAIIPSSPEAFYVFLGASRIGAAVSFIDPRYGEDSIAQKINATNSDLVIAFNGVVRTFNRRSRKLNDHGILQKVLNVIDRTPATKIVYIPMATSVSKLPIPIPSPKYQVPDGCKATLTSWKQFLRDGRQAETVFPEFEADRPVAIISTGGTTGTPKNAVLTNENIIKATAQIKMMGIFPEEARWYDIMPPFIAYGLADGSTLPFSLGNEVRLNPFPTAPSKRKPNQLLLVEDMVEFDPHTMTCAPNHVFAILNSEEWLENPHSLVQFGVGGDSLNLDAIARANEILKTMKRPADFDKERFFGQDEDRVVINSGYGATEVTGCASVGPSNKDTRFGTVGLTLTHQIVSAFDCDDEAGVYRELKYVSNDELDNVPEDKIGELCITGPNVMLEYLNNPDETAKVIRVHDDGRRWVHIGDQGYVDEDGYVHFVGRLKYIGVTDDGNKIAPVEIENVIQKKDEINHCKAVIYDDPVEKRASVIKVFYTLKDDASVQDIAAFEDELNELCSTDLADYKCPLGYKLLKSLPVTGSGKVDIMKLKADAEGEISL